MTAPATETLIITLQLEEDVFAQFDDLRQLHSPTAGVSVPAHATLFHNLPCAEETEITEALDRLAHDTAAPEITVTAIRFTGNGVAFTLESAALEDFRAKLAAAFRAWLTLEDFELEPLEVTVLDLAEPAEARRLHAALSEEFLPFRFKAPGLLLWLTHGRGWEPRAALLFGGTR